MVNVNVESLNLGIGLLSSDIALFHALYRTSIKGGKDLLRLMFSDEEDITGLIDSSYTSRVAEVFNVNLKELGIETFFDDDDTHIKILNSDVVKKHVLNGKVIFCTDFDFYLMQRREEIKQMILAENPVILSSRLNELVEDVLNSKKFLNGRHKLLE